MSVHTGVMLLAGVYACSCVLVPVACALCDVHVSVYTCVWPCMMCGMQIVCVFIGRMYLVHMCVCLMCVHEHTCECVDLKDLLENATQSSVDTGLASLGRRDDLSSLLKAPS